MQVPDGKVEMLPSITSRKDHGLCLLLPSAQTDLPLHIPSHSSTFPFQLASSKHSCQDSCSCLNSSRDISECQISGIGGTNEDKSDVKSKAEQDCQCLLMSMSQMRVQN